MVCHFLPMFGQKQVLSSCWRENGLATFLFTTFLVLSVSSLLGLPFLLVPRYSHWCSYYFSNILPGYSWPNVSPSDSLPLPDYSPSLHC